MPRGIFFGRWRLGSWPFGNWELTAFPRLCSARCVTLMRKLVARRGNERVVAALLHGKERLERFVRGRHPEGTQRQSHVVVHRRQQPERGLVVEEDRRCLSAAF